MLLTVLCKYVVVLFVINTEQVRVQKGEITKEESTSSGWKSRKYSLLGPSSASNELLLITLSDV